MNFKEALSRLEKSSEFRDFKKKHSDAYLCAGFFIKDYESKSDVCQIDFQCEEKIATFSIDGKIEIKMEETAEKKKIPQIKTKIKIDLEKAQEIAEKEAKKNKIVSKMKKIIAILQMHEEKEIWNVTCIFASFAMLRLHIDASTGKILKTEKANLFDFVQKPK
jgi:hypothetical protein